MKKQRWLSLVLILALVVGLCSVCAAAADDQTAEQPAQEAAGTYECKRHPRKEGGQ